MQLISNNKPPNETVAQALTEMFGIDPVDANAVLQWGTDDWWWFGELLRTALEGELLISVRDDGTPIDEFLHLLTYIAEFSEWVAHTTNNERRATFNAKISADIDIPTIVKMYRKCLVLLSTELLILRGVSDDIDKARLERQLRKVQSMGL
jgi:hypothetical protein